MHLRDVYVLVFFPSLTGLLVYGHKDIKALKILQGSSEKEKLASARFYLEIFNFYVLFAPLLPEKVDTFPVFVLLKMSPFEEFSTLQRG